MARYTPLPSVGRARPRNLRLADLYIRQGENQAEAELRSGAIKAALFNDLGKTVGQTASNIIQAPQMAREQAAAETERAQRSKMNALTFGEAERSINDRENLDLAMTAGTRQKTLAALKDRPELYEKAQGHYAKIDASMKSLLESAAGGIADFGYTPEAANAALDDLVEQGFDANKLKPYREAFKSPEQIKTIVDRMLGIQPKVEPGFELGPGQTRFNAQGEAIASVPANAPNKPNPTEASLAMAAAAGDPEAIKALELIRQQRPAPQGREPERPSVWVNKDGASRFVTPTQAAQMSTEGWASGNSREQGRPVTSGDAGRITELNTSLDDVAVLGDAISEKGSTGTRAAIGAALPNVVTEWTGWGANAKAKQALIDRVKQVIGKSLEDGVLRKEDERKYEKILPTIKDPNDLVLSKLNGLNAAIAKRKQRHLDSLADAGYDTSKFIARDGAKDDDPLGIRPGKKP